ncbi:MAG: 4a-hydroxytetrahydrobiopterin dehydratase [Candidatus Omnitrophica bacterium]|nr:4a-hydroxytetrahydrobiopterin dehydratase [Candidatus Omnitrophota bacterium]
MTQPPLAQRKCKPCEGMTEPLQASAAQALLADLTGWELVDLPAPPGGGAQAGGKAIRKTVTCKDFLDAVGLIQRIAPIAEAEDHHPDLHLTGYRKLTIELSTHAIGGLSENDFILAAKIDAIL